VAYVDILGGYVAYADMYGSLCGYVGLSLWICGVCGYVWLSLWIRMALFVDM